jgi:hypothetical protein
VNAIALNFIFYFKFSAKFSNVFGNSSDENIGNFVECNFGIKLIEIRYNIFIFTFAVFIPGQTNKTWIVNRLFSITLSHLFYERQVQPDQDTWKEQERAYDGSTRPSNLGKGDVVGFCNTNRFRQHLEISI